LAYVCVCACLCVCVAERQEREVGRVRGGTRPAGVPVRADVHLVPAGSSLGQNPETTTLHPQF